MDQTGQIMVTMLLGGRIPDYNDITCKNTLDLTLSTHFACKSRGKGYHELVAVGGCSMGG